MVCFCDVYGHYGIGLTKEWGIRNGVSPVLYPYDQSPLTMRLHRSLEYTPKSLSKEGEDEFFLL